MVPGDMVAIVIRVPFERGKGVYVQCRAWLGTPFLTTRCAVSIKKEKRKQLTIGGARCPMGQVNSEADELSYDIGVCLVSNQLNIVFTSWRDIASCASASTAALIVTWLAD